MVRGSFLANRKDVPMSIPPLSAFSKYSRRIVGIDPGETTGISTFAGLTLVDADQLRTKTVDKESYDILRHYIYTWYPDEIVVEDYRVYGWKTEEHSFASLHTPKLIGMIIAICIQKNIPYTLRMAQPAKAFVTDEKLEAWDLLDKGKRHSRDSMRHALFQMCFPSKDISDPNK